MNVAQLIQYAGYLMQIINSLRDLAEKKGMDPAEFNAQVTAEKMRLDSWLSTLHSDAAKIFDD